jgi:hypothetical protein
LSAAVVGLVALTACDPEEETAEGRQGCAEVVKEASLAIEVDAQVRLLDDALRICRSFATLETELERYPSIIGYEPATFVALRCERIEDRAVRRGPTCSEVVTPTTTIPETTVAPIVFVGDTLDGRTIEIRPSATTEFVGDVPAVVQQTVDIATESGCAGVIEQRDLWASRVDDPQIGDEASVYAQHAQNVATYIQCDPVPLPTAPAADG